MKLLFFARHYSYLRLFESAISDLASRGHQIHLSADREESMGGRRLAERLADTYPGVTLGATPGRAADAWSEFSRRLRLGIDYLRYLEPRYADTPHLKARARNRAPRSVVAVAERLPDAGARASFARLLRQLERGIPPSQELAGTRSRNLSDDPARLLHEDLPDPVNGSLRALGGAQQRPTVRQCHPVQRPAQSAPTFRPPSLAAGEP